MIRTALPGAEFLFSDRTVDLRAEPEHFGPVRRGRQVHGTRVVVDSTDVQEADGQVVTDREHGALVLVADCLPIGLAAPGAAAMLHGGWRGLAAGIVAEGVAALDGAARAAVIGPGARGCCYEVGEEVHARFADYDARVGERNLALEWVAAAQLAAAGITDVEDTGVCTICDARYFSYRREGEAAGRQGGVAWRRD